MTQKQIVIERRVKKKLSVARIKDQLQKIADTAMKSGRGTGWTYRFPQRITDPVEEGEFQVYRITLIFSTTSNRESLLDKWERIVKRFAESGCAGQFRGSPWTVIDPTGYQEIASKAKIEDQKAKTRKVMQDEDKVLGEINLDPNDHYARLFNREPQINRILGALRLGKRTDWAKRTHSILDGPPGCHVAGTQLLRSTGEIVLAEDVQVGDRLLSHDGYRNVKELVCGNGNLYSIIPVKGEPFVVNEDHILTLSRSKGRKKGDLLDVSVKEWLCWSNNRKSNYKLIRSNEIEFETPIQTLPIPAYAMGVLLGDGSVVEGQSPRITCHEADFPFVPEITYLAEQFGLKVNCNPRAGKSGDIIEISITGTKNTRNPLMEVLSDLELEGCNSGTKFIPEIYKTSSVRDRLELMAGYIDTDGEYHGGVMTITTKSEKLANDSAFVARSLGFAAYLSTKKVMYEGEWRIYHVVNLSGELSRIPCRHQRKRAEMRRQIKSVLRTGFTVEFAGVGDFYGFVLDGDHRYLMGDFTITHNCGKTEIMLSTSRMLGEENKAWRWFDATSMTKAGVLEELIESPVVPPVLFIEEIEKCDEASLRWLLGVMDTRGQIRRTNYRVGNQAKHVRMCVIASANDVQLLQKLMSGALYSRFQNKIYCPRPDRVVMEQILIRECEEIAGKKEWIEPTLEFACDKWCMTDPRDVITIMSCGGDDLLKGSYQKDYEATMHPSDKRRLLKSKKRRDGDIDGTDDDNTGVQPAPKHRRKIA